MFSNFGREAYDSRPANYEGLLDVLQHSGLAVVWIDNQSGCKGVCDRVASVDTTSLKVPGLCDGGECFDEVMLQNMEERIAALPAERRARGVVVVMHQIGGHGPAYYQRSPPAFKKFLPECINNALQSCGRDELMNAYDNSVVYADHLLGSAIRWLKTQEAHNSPAMLYVADHGESLGEKQPLPAWHALRDGARRAKARTLDHLAVAGIRTAQQYHHGLPQAAARCAGEP
ncbi:sulfatase-like hydrolase/transferase [Polaromonas sp. P1(28)-8]|nr:sulfatase-like hydrolase/transferase [Polaromonas sp. P1(28)-8]